MQFTFNAFAFYNVNKDMNDRKFPFLTLPLQNSTQYAEFNVLDRNFY